MALAALIAWLVTAAGGFALLATWVAKGGVRQQPRASHFPPALIFGHFLLAAAGLVVWIVYVVVDKRPLAWAAFIILLPVALLGFTMLARWIPVYRDRQIPVAAGGPGTAAASDSQPPPERHFPVPVVGAHGVLAVVTLVLVLLTALNVGGS